MTTRARPSRITVLVHFNRISLFYTLAPLLLSKDVARRLDFTQSVDYCLRRDRNRVLLVVRYFEGQGLRDGRVDLRLMERLRDKYQRVAFFDDGAGAGCTRFEVLPFVDLYLKKQILRDRSAYRGPLYGRQLYSDYYHRTFGVIDSTFEPRAPLDPRHESKLRLTWNLGVGSFPLRPLSMRLGVALARCGAGRLAFSFYRRPLNYRPRNQGRHEVLARFSSPGRRPSVFFQRELLQRHVGRHPRFLTGLARARQYRDEIRNSQITLSPFGWGEVCFRDFEAVLNDSLLLKPHMDHLQTWPDIYRPHETYVPVSWDGDDVVERAEQFLADSAARRRIVASAKNAYFDALRQMDQRAQQVAEWIVGQPANQDGIDASANHSQAQPRVA